MTLSAGDEVVSVRVDRRPYRRLLVWTAVLLMPTVLLGILMSAPVAEGCFEYCDLNQRFAGIGFVFLGVVWLLGALKVARSWRDREPTIAAASAVAVAPCLAIVAIRFFGVVPFDTFPDEIVMLSWVLGIGLQLPPVWRLTSRPVPSLPLRVIATILGVVATVAAVAVSLGGTDVAHGGGSSIVALAWFVFVICLIPVPLAAWRDGVASRRLMAPLLVACLPTLLLPAGIAAPGDIGYVIYSSVPLIAIAWLWIGFGWLGESRSIVGDGVGLTLADTGD